MRRLGQAMNQRIAGIGSVLLLAVALQAQEVETDHNPQFDFSQLQTFAVKVGTPWGDPASESAVQKAVTKDLSQKGWKETDLSSCDALVILHGARPGKQTFRSFYEDQPGYSWHDVGAPALADTTDFDYKPGTLMLDIFEAKTKRVVFRGVVQDLAGKSADNEQKIDQAIKKMLKSVPSGRNGASKNKSGSREPNNPSH
jgi:Domain of unknown function (DUF4136)